MEIAFNLNNNAMEAISSVNFGIELETVYNGEDLLGFSNHINWIVASDLSIRYGSIYSHSAEIQTPKLSLNLENLKDVFSDIREIRRRGARVNKTCGMHVHISSPLFYKVNFMSSFLSLIRENQEEMFRIFKPTSRRSFRFCRRVPDVEIINMISSIQDVADVNGNIVYEGNFSGLSNKFNFINFTNLAGTNNRTRNRKNTIEFRIFNGSMNCGKVLANLEFIFNLIYVASREGSYPDRSCDLVSDDLFLDYPWRYNKYIKYRTVENVSDVVDNMNRGEVEEMSPIISQSVSF